MLFSISVQHNVTLISFTEIYLMCNIILVLGITTQWFDINIFYKMININPVTIFHHTKLLQYSWWYLCCILYSHGLLYNWKFVPQSPPISQNPPPPYSPATTCCVQWVCFYFVVWIFRFHISVKSYSICFTVSDLFHLPWYLLDVSMLSE